MTEIAQIHGAYGLIEARGPQPTPSAIAEMVSELDRVSRYGFNVRQADGGVEASVRIGLDVTRELGDLGMRSL